MGRTLPPALAVVLLLALAGCGGSGAGTSTTDTVVTTAAQETTTAPETTPAVTTEAEPPTPEPTTVTIVVEGGAPVGGIERVSVKKGENVVLVVRSDVADEIHLHGYDLSQDVAAGGVARIAFVASLPGRFEAELEQLGVHLAELTVNP